MEVAPATPRPSPLRLVLIDDDRHQAKFIVGGLKMLSPAFEIRCINSADSAHKFIHGPASAKAALFLVDVMMPHGRMYTSAQTSGGETTGFALAADIRKKNPRVPIVLWSTDPFSQIEKRAKAHARQLQRCAFIRKENAMRNVMLAYQGIVDDRAFSTDALGRLKRWAGLAAESAFRAVISELVKHQLDAISPKM